MFKIQADWNNIIVESEKLLRCENTLLDGGMLSLSPYILAIVILMCLIYPLMIKSGCRGLLLWFRCCMSCFFFFKSEQQPLFFFFQNCMMQRKFDPSIFSMFRCCQVCFLQKTEAGVHSGKNDSGLLYILSSHAPIILANNLRDDIMSLTKCLTAYYMHELCKVRNCSVTILIWSGVKVKFSFTGGKEVLINNTKVY